MQLGSSRFLFPLLFPLCYTYSRVFKEYSSHALLSLGVIVLTRRRGSLRQGTKPQWVNLKSSQSETYSNSSPTLPHQPISHRSVDVTLLHNRIGSGGVVDKVRHKEQPAFLAHWTRRMCNNACERGSSPTLSEPIIDQELEAIVFSAAVVNLELVHNSASGSEIHVVSSDNYRHLRFSRNTETKE
jgi:hypothetical protein